MPIEHLDPLSLALVDRWQRDFPFSARPFQSIADELGSDEGAVLERLRMLVEAGYLTRIGAVVRPHTAGASTLAAMAVETDELETVAALIDAEPGVNHNYQRANAINLWFVATAHNEDELEEILQRIELRTRHELLRLPLVKAYHIDLGFSIGGGRCLARTDAAGEVEAIIPTADDRRLLAVIEDGLPLVSRPYREIGRRLGLAESAVMRRLGALVDGHVISRFGLVVRHRRFGFTANAMAVWQVDAERIDALGAEFARQPFVTLCYQRRPALPRWPFNLYCMIHGRERTQVESQIARLNELDGGQSRRHEVLFSTRCFKQRGANFSSARPIPDRLTGNTMQRAADHA